MLSHPPPPLLGVLRDTSRCCFVLPKGILLVVIRQTIRGWMERALEAAQQAGQLPPGEVPAFEVEIPRSEQFGDYSTNLAMVLARQVRRNPREVADILLAHLPEETRQWVERAEIAGAGFLNFYLKPGWTGEVVRHILQQGEHYGETTLGAGKRVLIEFVSANPTGPLTLGHGRNATVGDTLARLFQALGYQVEREFYINDGQSSTKSATSRSPS
jgi:arginyl-tRNA synthetase